MLFRPAESSKKIVDFYRNYLLTTFKTNKDEYNQQLKNHLSKDESLAKGPYINLTDPFTKDKTIHELTQEGILSPLFLQFNKFHPYRPLYRHQVESIRKAVNRKNLIVTTGTGSGKTECFLIPVVNQLLRERENGTLSPGIRTMIIYPMNALVNDQIRRLREIFEDAGIEDITFGRFTGETKEFKNDALREYIDREGRKPIKNELISREQMRATPPHILITNYAMLEYLLLRPGDNIIFNKESAHLWQTIVFDEAHTYSGAKGIEVSNLIKRVKAMLDREDIQFILTSATLGDEDENPKIIKFANMLCTASFDNESIIRAHTTPPEIPERFWSIDFQIYRDIAQSIRDNLADSHILEILQEHNIPIVEKEDNTTSLEETLYQMIRHDLRYHELRNKLIGNTKLISELAKEQGVTEDDVTDFIAVASKAEKNGDKIFEARYHMFLKGLEGVYVTLAPSNKLFIHKMETYKEDQFSDDIGYQVYEISFCHNCYAIYLTGQEEDGRFVQKSRYDENFSPDVYLLSGDYDFEEELEQKAYNLCAKCGALGLRTSLSSLCEHSEEYYNMVIKVKDKDEKLHVCPCCHARNTKYSITRPFYLRNEAATAVIATALYNELPHIKVTRKIESYEDEFFESSSEIEILEKEKITKQFLVFSDSRQAAAYFATYLEQTYQTHLFKRLLTKTSENLFSGNIKSVSLNRFVNELEQLLIEYHIIAEDKANKEAWIHVLKELINFKARNSLQYKGILYFDLDFKLPHNNKLNLTSDEVTTLFKIFYNEFIRIGAISYPITLTRAEEKRLLYVGFTKGFDRHPTKKSYIDGWLPDEGKENKRTKLLKKIFPDMNLLTRRSLLESIFKLLLDHQCIIHQKDRYLVNWEKIKVNKVEKLYQCTTCKMITPLNLRNICHNFRCEGTLVNYDFESDLQHDHYYRIYRDLPLVKMVVKEHTAQLGSNKAFDYQNDFINEKINVLSCSTTFEMGVDVGTLETVFMRNMPPSPANYAQRAGRAGRSSKSAAYSITFCPNNSHDLNYFKNPVSMIRGSIQAPSLNINNEKIVQRHIFASAIAFFWKRYPKYYQKSIGKFIEVDGYDYFQYFLKTKPKELKEYLHKIVPKQLVDIFGIDEFTWVHRLISDDSHHPGVFTIAINKYLSDLHELESALENYEKEKLKHQAGSKEFNQLNSKIQKVGYSIWTLKDQNIIDFLSRNNIIPKYGFPVDTVELTSLNVGGNIQDLRLDRDLTTALSEYVPASEVVADGKLYTSRYVRVLNNYSWPKYNYVYCDHCNTLNRTIWTDENLQECKQCGMKLLKPVEQYIVPKFGFLMDNKGPEEVVKKPERTYRGSISYIGDENKVEFKEFNINGQRVLIGTSKMDELAVLNTSNFYICETCGYGELLGNNFNDKVMRMEHDNPNGYPCSNQELIPLSLGHDFQTDVAHIKFVDQNIDTLPKAWTILYSLLEGLSRYLSIERSEISGTLHWYRNEFYGNVGHYGFVLFDQTPGGAGYVRELRDINVFKQMLRQGYLVVENCECGGEAKDTACYSCLCNYYNQRQHDLLQRIHAINFYESILNNDWDNISVEINSTKKDQVTDKAFSKRTGTFNDDGQNQSSMSFIEIWNYIADDTNDELEKKIFEELKVLSDEFLHYKPVYGGSVRLERSSDVIYPDLIWPEQKVMLFLKDNYNEFERGLETDWHCFITDDSFNMNLFLKLIKGED